VLCVHVGAIQKNELLIKGQSENSFFFFVCLQGIFYYIYTLRREGRMIDEINHFIVPRVCESWF
jgi:hypothetical protein